MAMFKTVILATILAVPLLDTNAARTDDEPDPDAHIAEQFSDRLTDVIRDIADHYFHEIDSGELLRWAVKGLEAPRGKTVPARLAQQLDNARDWGRTELRRFLTEFAKERGGDLRPCADAAVKRLVDRLDGRTRVIGRNDSFGPPGGIGVRLAVDPATDMLRVEYPFFNGPAYRSGLRSGDVITEMILPKPSMPNEPPPGVDVIPTKGLAVATAQLHLNDYPGTSVYLNVRRPGVDKQLEFTVVRAKEEPETVFGVRRDNGDRWDHWLDAPRKIGYLRLSGFRANTHQIVANELAGLHMQGMKGLVLDLRNNNAGLVNVAAPVAGIFVGNAPLFSVKVRDQEDDVFQGDPVKSFRNFPMVCLVNGDTTQLGEVLASCLQDNRRALILGERTEGRASIQHYVVHGGDFKVIITAGVFFRPNGKKLDRISPPGKPSDEWGVTPDPGYELKLTADEREQLRARFECQLMIPPPGQAPKEGQPTFKDRQLEMAMAYLRDKSSDKKR